MTFNRHRGVWIRIALVTGWTTSIAAAQDYVSETVHNLSITGPGLVRATSERQVCVFCHATHNTGGLRPLWNRDLSGGSYSIYQSSTLDASPGQPTGASKLCLSCHDGTIALGSVLSREDRIRMSGGDYIPAGLGNLGTDLSDDHPVSFFYTSGLAASDHQLINPTLLTDVVGLDATGQLQCTACHDPHYNRNGDFLVMPGEYGALCITCHNMDGWSGSSHQTVESSVTASPTGDFPYATVAQNACRSCHRPHTAGGHERLQIFANEEENCLCCHDGSVAQTNISLELGKLTAHDPRNYTDKHDPAETHVGDAAHVECADCHNGHAVRWQAPSGSQIAIGATLDYVKGMNSGGAIVDRATYEYEVCFRCHADGGIVVTARVPRQVQQPNLRFSFTPGNPSTHPVVLASNNPDVVSLVSRLPLGSTIRCTDCHNNDTGRRAGGGGPDGPHGSSYHSLLERNYTTDDGTPESGFEYALCYKCHRRSSILTDQSFSDHEKHIVEERASCSACHDPHGVSLSHVTGSDHTSLINFDTRIVQPLPPNLQPLFRDDGSHAGSCTLVCHGEEHDDERYP